MNAVVLFPIASMKGRISVAPKAQFRPILDKRKRTMQSSFTYFFLILQSKCINLKKTTENQYNFNDFNIHKTQHQMTVSSATHFSRQHMGAFRHIKASLETKSMSKFVHYIVNCLGHQHFVVLFKIRGYKSGPYSAPLIIKS